MRNIILFLALVLGCSFGNDGGAVTGHDASPPRRGPQVSGGEQAVQASDAQPRASQDAQAPDSVAIPSDTMPAQPDTTPMTFDTTPTPPPVTWTPGAESTDPALATCPSTKGNSLGIGKACSNAVGGERCPEGLQCLCGGEAGTIANLFPKGVPCMCTVFRCDDCGAGAGCCFLRGSKDTQYACLLNSCSSYCRMDPVKGS